MNARSVKKPTIHTYNNYQLTTALGSRMLGQLFVQMSGTTTRTIIQPDKLFMLCKSCNTYKLIDLQTGHAVNPTNHQHFAVVEFVDVPMYKFKDLA